MQIPRMCFIFTVPGRPLVRRLLLRPPAHWPKRPSPRRVLSLLDGEEWKGTRQEAEAELRRRIQMISQLLDWPRLSVASQDYAGWETVLEDGLAWCVAASKRTGNVVLLDREPNLERLSDVKPIVLHFPERRCMR